MPATITINMASDLYGLKGTLNDILTHVKDINPIIPDEIYMDLRLIFSELLANAILHGNKNNQQKNVYINIDLSEDVIISKIVDEGDGFNYAEALTPPPEEDFFAETGRGIRLVQSLTDELKFNHAGNEIWFVKNFQ